MSKRKSLLLLCAMAGALLAGCAAPSSPPAAVATLQVSGSVSYRERIALPPDAEIVVQLQDVSRMDAPAVVLAEQRIRAEGRQVPFVYALPVDPARIDARMRYTVSARILRGGQLLFINDTAHPVLTQGAGRTADLVLVRTAGR